MLPRKIEVEQHYLEEALQVLTNTQSEGFKQIVAALFQRTTPDLVELTYDTDIAAKANNLATTQGSKRAITPSEGLVRAISEIRAGAVDVSFLGTLAMSNPSLISATLALRRARNAGNIGKGGKGIILKRSMQRVAGILAMASATSAAVSANMDGVHGADPRVVEALCARLTAIFQSHGAVNLRSPLLRPRPNMVSHGHKAGPAELIDVRGHVVLLPEDLTAPL